MRITSAQNPKLKEALKLQNRRARDETGSFLIEGYRELSRVDPGMVERLFVCPDLFLGENEEALIETLEAEVFELPEHLFRKLSYRDRPDGLVGVATKMNQGFHDLKEGFLVVAEAIEKPGNLGAILRSADGGGAGGVIICDRCTDIYNPNVVRSSVGTLFTQPVIEATSVETIRWLKENGYAIVAATPSAENDFTESDLSGKVALVVGTEQLGLSELWLEAADIQVSIPMNGVADSLNVSVAATLLMYEVVRQRRGAEVLR
ncbi:MAG: 23S rRNA (uridine(2479)-2'-O)-methyltransferase [Chlamydiae bacterium]|nr:23S rRNA (uridine(2479)-2'-O)-methyltransferase [Chlamydiota bacterium]